jgi:hypothetical protein
VAGMGRALLLKPGRTVGLGTARCILVFDTREKAVQGAMFACRGVARRCLPA